MTRFVRWAERDDLGDGAWTFKIRVARRGGKWKEEDRKRTNLERAAQAAGGLQGRRLRDLAAAWLHRRAAWLGPLEKQGFALRFRARTEWRLTIGLAGASPLETSIQLHHVFGVPVLPGSGLKGLTLATARADADSSAYYEEALGTPEAAGLVDILDAIPIPRDGQPLLEVDVMNPHYPLWYRREKDARGGRIPPSDDQSPNPVFFLTVPAGLEFEFALVCRARTDAARAALPRAAGWLRAGLSELGAGAKTAAGYGYFTAVTP